MIIEKLNIGDIIIIIVNRMINAGHDDKKKIFSYYYFLFILIMVDYIYIYCGQIII